MDSQNIFNSDMIRIDLDENALKVLNDVYQNGMVRGVELRNRVNLPTDELQTTVKKLAGNSLVAVSGNMNGTSEALRSYISIRPSAAGFVKNLLKM